MTVLCGNRQHGPNPAHHANAAIVQHCFATGLVPSDEDWDARLAEIDEQDAAEIEADSLEFLRSLIFDLDLDDAEFTDGWDAVAA